MEKKMMSNEEIAISCQEVSKALDELRMETRLSIRNLETASVILDRISAKMEAIDKGEEYEDVLNMTVDIKVMENTVERLFKKMDEMEEKYSKED